MKSKLFRALVSAIYPNKCICCGELISNDEFICKKCNLKIERLNFENLCLNCGLETQNCECKYKIYRFKLLVSAFKNEGLAQKAYYNYKFGKRQHYSKFFAAEICNSIKKCYDNINFDVVCAVPSFERFGYKHSNYLARCIANELKIPYDDLMLSCIKRTKKQHKSTITERINNIDGKYIANHTAKGLNILLIDDIKTTGSTIDECSKVLLFAGADNVYCATALVSVINKN